MNVEINFLTKKEKRKLAPYLLTLLTVLLISLVVGTIYKQVYQLSNEIAENRERLAELESSLSEYQANSADQRNLIQLQETVDVLMRDTLPSVSLYHNVLVLLDTEDQLVYYHQNSPHQFMLETRFSNFNSVTVFVSDLLEQPYIKDVQLDSVNQVERGYEAKVTITFDEIAVKKELSANE